MTDTLLTATLWLVFATIIVGAIAAGLKARRSLPEDNGQWLRRQLRNEIARSGHNRRLL
jgi:hypothetical protein